MHDRHPSPFAPLLVVVALAAMAVTPAIATDVDGANDCIRDAHDYADAPELVQAYPGVPGAFPTCLAAGPIGTQSLATAPISTPPGPAGYVHHLVQPFMPPFWLGCTPLGPPSGLDGEVDGKTNDNGTPASACQPMQPVDAYESAFGLTFGQDEQYGGTDAAIASPLTFGICQPASFAFTAYNCAPVEREVFLNVCLDMDQDGDWNDNHLCPSGAYAFEWALKNVPILLPPGCTLLQSPAFLVGPNAGPSWMRVTLTAAPVPDDFPWNGSGSSPGEAFQNGETEDYPVVLRAELCPEYSDFGDAPDDFLTYGGTVVGNFPTCIFAGLVGTRQTACPPISTAPQSTGYVEHRASVLGTQMVWLGCTPSSVDAELDGKTNLTGGGVASICNQAVTTDCTESMPWGTPMGQDECYGDLDACLTSPVTFETCRPETLTFSLYNCGPQVASVHLNLLVDWNQDGDWNDNFLCSGGVCVYEWPVKNQSLLVPPGCSSHTVILPYAGPFVGDGWMRVSISDQAVNDDFPWAGSMTMTPPYLAGGETEDFPVSIVVPPVCSPAYRDFGDAPEGYPAYGGGGPIGMFPTCATAAIGIARWDDYCATPAPAPALTPTGFVEHNTAAGDPLAFWLGCGSPGPPTAGRDGESDGKTSDFPAMGLASFCNPLSVTADCVESAFGWQFGQDECYGDSDAGLRGFVQLQTCVPNTISFQTYSCAAGPQDVYLNVLVDMNQDGDWVDHASCPGSPPVCPWEWTVQNVLVTLPSGCGTVTAPPFLVGARNGLGWMRITLSEQPAPTDFPWAGTQSLAGLAFLRGETEDYPVELVQTADVRPATPGRSTMAPMTPNPARLWTSARFTLAAALPVELAAYDVGGRRVRALFEGTMSAGAHEIRWDLTDDVGRPVPAGLYLVSLRAGDEVFVRRAIRID